MCKSSLWISDSSGICEFNRLASWNKSNTMILYDHHFKYANWKYWFHIQRKLMSNVNMSVQKVFLKETFVLMCLESVCFWHFRDHKHDCWTTRHVLCEENMNLFRKWVDKNSCRKVKYIWSWHFPDVISTNMLIGNAFFVFK